MGGVALEALGMGIHINAQPRDPTPKAKPQSADLCGMNVGMCRPRECDRVRDDNTRDVSCFTRPERGTTFPKEFNKYNSD